MIKRVLRNRRAAEGDDKTVLSLDCWGNVVTFIEARLLLSLLLAVKDLNHYIRNVSPKCCRFMMFSVLQWDDIPSNIRFPHIWNIRVVIGSVGGEKIPRVTDMPFKNLKVLIFKLHPLSSGNRFLSVSNPDEPKAFVLGGLLNVEEVFIDFGRMNDPYAVHIESNKMLRKLEANNVNSINIRNCPSLIDISVVMYDDSLTHSAFSNIFKSQENLESFKSVGVRIQSVSCQKSLKYLCLENSYSLLELRDLPELKEFFFLGEIHMPVLTDLPLLEIITLSNGPSLKTYYGNLHTIKSLKSLKILRVSYFLSGFVDELKLDDFQSLEEISLRRCMPTSLTRFHPEKIRVFSLENTKFTSNPQLSSCKNIENFRLIEDRLKLFENEDKLKDFLNSSQRMKNLHIEILSSLTNILPVPVGLGNLETLVLQGNFDAEKIENLPKLKKLVTMTKTSSFLSRRRDGLPLPNLSSLKTSSVLPPFSSLPQIPVPPSIQMGRTFWDGLGKNLVSVTLICLRGVGIERTGPGIQVITIEDNFTSLEYLSLDFRKCLNSKFIIRRLESLKNLTISNFLSRKDGELMLVIEHSDTFPSQTLRKLNIIDSVISKTTSSQLFPLFMSSVKELIFQRSQVMCHVYAETSHIFCLNKFVLDRSYISSFPTDVIIINKLIVSDSVLGDENYDSDFVNDGSVSFFETSQQHGGFSNQNISIPNNIRNLEVLIANKQHLESYHDETMKTLVKMEICHSRRKLDISSFDNLLDLKINNDIQQQRKQENKIKLRILNDSDEEERRDEIEVILSGLPKLQFCEFILRKEIKAYEILNWMDVSTTMNISLDNLNSLKYICLPRVSKCTIGVEMENLRSIVFLSASVLKGVLDLTLLNQNCRIQMKRSVVLNLIKLRYGMKFIKDKKTSCNVRRVSSFFSM